MHDPLVPISALQHWLFCPRQFALIHLECEWKENRLTADGRVFHEAAHSGLSDSRKSVRVTRSMPVVSEAAGLIGQCDVVELHFGSTHRKTDRPDRVIPIEYKRGRPKGHRADEVQLCAQAICLESMFNLTINEGFLFYGKTQRRVSISIDAELRKLTMDVIQAIKACLASGLNPPTEYASARCDQCSLIEICSPKASRYGTSVADTFKQALKLDTIHA